MRLRGYGPKDAASKVVEQVMDNGRNRRSPVSIEDFSRRKTILLVEDDSFVREVTSEILQGEGYRVWAASNGVEAARIFDERGEGVDLLLTDVVLPGKSGPALAAEMRTKSSSIKVLYVTGYAEQMNGLYESGQECLAKPFTSDELLKEIERVIDQEERGRDAFELMQACASA